MKRIIALIIAISLFIVPIHTYAANEVFVGINNAMLPLNGTMPFYSGGVWYVDYLDFTRGDLSMSASYNKDLGTAVLYNWDVTLVFNVGKGTAYKEGGTQFNQRSFFRNGTIYVPAAFVCEQFGITFSYLSEVSTIRFRTTSGMSDSMFVYIARNRIPDLIAAYNASNQPSPSPDTPVQPSGDSTDEEKEDYSKNVVYITINVSDPSKLAEISTVLSNYSVPATLFISKDAMNDGNLLRRLNAGRSTIGIYAATTSEATEANELLYANTRSKTRLLRADTALPDAEVNGYRQWGFSLDARTRSATQVNNLLNTRANTVLIFDDSDNSIAKLRSVLAHVNKQKFTIRVIDLMTTPIAP